MASRFIYFCFTICVSRHIFYFANLSFFLRHLIKSHNIVSGKESDDFSFCEEESENLPSTLEDIISEIKLEKNVENLKKTENNQSPLYKQPSENNLVQLEKHKKNSLKDKEDEDKNYLSILLKDGRKLKSLHDFENSLKIFKEVLESDEMTVEQEAICNNEIGQVYILQKNYNKSLNHFSKSLKLYEKLRMNEEIVVLCNNVGLILIDLKKNCDMKKVMVYFNKALEISRKVEEYYLLRHTLNNLIMINCQIQNYENAIKYSFESLEMVKKKVKQNRTPLKTAENSILLRIAEIYLKNEKIFNNLNKYFDNIIEFEKDEKVKEETDNDDFYKKKIDKMMEQVETHLENLDYQSCFSQLENVVNFALKIGDNLQKLNCLECISNNQYLLLYLNRTFEFVLNSFNVAVLLNDYKKQEILIYFIGKFLLKKGKLSTSMKYFVIALKFAKKQKNGCLVAMINNHFGTLFFEERDYNKSIQYLRKALMISMKVENEYLQFLISMNLSSVLCTTKQYEESVELLSKFLYSKNKKILVSILAEIIKIHKTTNNFEKAQFFTLRLSQMVEELK